ncbi:conserved hypothetical protein [Dinoroseobacter shibae DFL 12 = DSM 16493]|jgi:uncharacterized membrane-anchored protein|uniref:Membrane-anchored protein n=1 Tax=Dinoroseobacter shibae (strain DSM 16493 / NCIMB 14021 / DFL 12) TaxID=398580 RepID=A8LIR4_DINSH|nr:DUF3422 domain-containing protein [Dinoroseobacter shibae]ABV93028.1 conserved hypothetical protein [Dinoroseobacter shibae DFL 12 = DSM 16493]URF47960.1 DUF3422 domain-containing protein [Dinoroseobacter shibae]URF52269.1 DUF3422 domain-containing protein [Dinoroseobacter shibae]
MPAIEDHPLRYALANELHARPFPELSAPCHAVFLAIKQPQDAAMRNRDLDRAHLIELLDRYGAPHPSPGATHFSGQIGKHTLKWESHTEFVTFTIFVDGTAARPFDPDSFDVFPEDWLKKAPGMRMGSSLIRVEERPSKEEIKTKLESWFVPESLAVSQVLDDSAVIAGDFRIDAGGHSRFAIFVGDDIGKRRVGRILQRVTEIETYKTVSMLGLARARTIGGQLNEIDDRLSDMVGSMSSNAAPAEDTLTALLEISADLENLMAQSSFRFGATRAYEALVTQRIEVLREERFDGRQTFAEFMMRRFDPAMRTVKATERRMQQMADRATRAAELLRTRVDVERQTQNQALLESMDRRAALQLRLQKTVEGLSVVAISYYAVNLAIYLIGPLAYTAGVSKTVLTAAVTPLVVLGVWFLVRRIREGMEK